MSGLAEALLAAAIATEIRADFEGGSMARASRAGDAHWRIEVKGESDQDGRNRQASWYYFRVDGAPRAEMIFDITGLPGEYNYRPNRGAITADTPPVVSYDGKT
ncbi:MAG: M14-type cytosolic carboxypeptidase, partial [Bryobacteraceae bacterium]